MGKNTTSYNVDAMTPDEVGAVRVLVKEFISRAKTIDAEVELLKEDKKNLIEEFKEKLDWKTLQAAMKVVKIEQGVQHKDTYDLFVEALTQSGPDGSTIE